MGVDVGDCIVQIAGKVSNRQIAVNAILEHIENFKIGGPVLRSGRKIFVEESESRSPSPSPEEKKPDKSKIKQERVRTPSPKS
jgi:hypothetical protein